MILTLEQHEKIDRLIQNEMNETYYKYQKDNCECWKNHLEKLEKLKKEWNDGNKFSIDFNIELLNKDTKLAFEEAVNLVKKYMKKATDFEIDNFLLKLELDKKTRENEESIANAKEMARRNGLNCDTILEKLDEIENQKVIITSLEMNNEKLSNAIEEKEAEIQTLKEENESLKKQLNEKNQEIQHLREQLGQIPDETKTADICPDSEPIINPMVSCSNTTFHFLNEKEIKELWEKVKRPNAVDDFGNILILSIQ